MENNVKPKNLYTVYQFVERLDGTVTTNAIYHLIKTGKIPVIHIGSRKLIPAKWVDEFLSSAQYE